ncbi:MAG: WecB/TagA/CpsF family glycosyltransferase [Victivallales bacterium]|nr:WecB/TagA/CpsF family glycosyltransferase [Victivallales bacterium]
MPRIFFSAMAYDSGRSGVSVYINNVLRELAAKDDCRLDVAACRDDIELLPKSEKITYIRVPPFFCRPLVNMFWHLFILPFTVRWRNYDFAVLPAGNRRLFCRCPKFTVAVVHDLAQYHVKRKYDGFRTFYFRRVLPFFLKRVNRVVAVSGSTAADLERYWHIPASRITVNHNGYDRKNFNSGLPGSEALLERLGIDREYILYVSRIEHPGKNHLALLKAYERLPEALRKKYLLVLAGSFWSGAEAVREYAENSPEAANIRFTGFLPQTEIAPLYRHAAMYVFPSLFEGFGLSLLEAMACGVPTACSVTSSLGEIAADAARRFDPEDIDDMALAMREVLEQPELQRRLVANGYRRLRDFDWEKHADKLLEIYEQSNGILPRRPFCDRGVRILGVLPALAAACIFALPLLLLTFFRKLFTGKKMFYKTRIYGKHERIIKIRYFNVRNRIYAKATLFYYVLTFRLRLVGVSIRKYPGEYRQLGDVDLFMDCPGIFSLWFLRMSRGIAYSGRLDTELRYVSERTLYGDAMILLRSLAAIIFFNPAKAFPPRIRLLDVEFDNMNMKEVLAAFAKTVVAGEKKKVYFVNAECFNVAAKDSEYLEILRNGDYILPDGIGMLLACKMLKIGLKENINGTDMLPFLCELAENEHYSVFLFGAGPGVAAAMRIRLETAYPGLRIVGVSDGYLADETVETLLIEELKRLRPDILLVALGAPLQEKWIAAHAAELPCRLLIGVGGLFDFYSGRIRRAPVWLREIGLEWLFRLLMEPRKRCRRYLLGNPLFLWRVRNWIRKQERNE